MISINSVFKYVDVEDGERIRIIELDENYVYIVNIDAVTSMPRKESLNKIIEEIECSKLIKIKDPYIKIIEDDELSQVQLSKRNEDWGFIEKYWEVYKDDILNKTKRSKAFKLICDESGKGMNKVKRLFSRFWQRGMNKNALIPDYDKSGGRGKEKKLNSIKTGKPRRADYLGNKIEGINITDDIKKQFAFVIDKYYRNNKKASLKETYTLMLKDFYSDSYIEDDEIKHRVWDESRIPTYDQFYYWFKKKENLKKDIIFRESEKEFNLKHRQLLSNSTQETDGPGTRFQVDATIADIYLVSSLNRNRVIGRPVVYAIIDVFSRMIIGIYVGLEGPSWIGAMMALDNMIADKVQFCKEYGIEISEEQWPCRHLPEIIIADRGEFEGYNVENLINNLNVKIENISPYRGDLKGIVERSFRTTNEKIKHKTPGAIQKEFRKRGDRDYRLDATLTLEEFTKIYINIVLHHNSKIILPAITDVDRNKTENLRYHIIKRTKNFLQPLPIHIELERKLSTLIRRGYLGRNPLDKSFLGKLRVLNRLDDTSIKENELQNELENIRTTADSISIIGISGIGKTTAIERLLLMYPQVIKHFEYKGESFI